MPVAYPFELVQVCVPPRSREPHVLSLRQGLCSRISDPRSPRQNDPRLSPTTASGLLPFASKETSSPIPHQTPSILAPQTRFHKDQLLPFRPNPSTSSAPSSLTQDGLVTVLEKMTMALISPVEAHCKACKKLPHNTGYGNLSCS